MATIKRTKGTNTYVRTRPSDRLTVSDILDFADALRESGIPTGTQITDEHAFETRHLTGLWARHSIREDDAE
jgi:hypothetical protein